MYNTLPMLTCEHDNYNNFYWILTVVKYVLRGMKILINFVDGRSSSKGLEMAEEEKFPFPITHSPSLTIPITPLLSNVERKLLLDELLPIYAKKLL